MSSYYLEVSNELKKIIKKLKREERINYPKLWLYPRLCLIFSAIFIISILIGVSFLSDIKNSTNLGICIIFLFVISFFRIYYFYDLLSKKYMQNSGRIREHT